MKPGCFFNTPYNVVRVSNLGIDAKLSMSHDETDAHVGHTGSSFEDAFKLAAAAGASHAVDDERDMLQTSGFFDVILPFPCRDGRVQRFLKNRINGDRITRAVVRLVFNSLGNGATRRFLGATTLDPTGTVVMVMVMPCLWLVQAVRSGVSLNPIRLARLAD
jgi:hypothetical protein